ncbi:serine hydrolase domain-containing protein [Novosphingobium sp.]|uniref:serine hydrolase domain-containing protein n=1 Tax=Novosphingobium sp. TaxID=1874826 RepID=UPI00333EE449
MELARPADHGFDASRLDRIADFVMRDYVGPGRFPGADILVARDGVPVWRATMGQMRADGTPWAPDAICRIASMTKPIVSIAFMMLVEQGLVALDDPVTRFVPEFANLRLYAGGGGDAPFNPGPLAAPMRMVDLLNHRSGLSYGIQNRNNIDAAYRKGRLDGHPGLDGNDAFIAGLAALPLEFNPGEAWQYSVSVDVLGVIVARISGQSLGTFLQERIFGPLGMVDTAFFCPADKAHRLADSWIHVPGDKPKQFDAAEKSGLLRQPRFDSGGGGLVSTTGDYHRFCRMLVGKGATDGVRLISPATLRLMTANHLRDPRSGQPVDLPQIARALFSDAKQAGTGFGLGFAVTIDPARTLTAGNAGEFFWSGIHSTKFFVDPTEGLSVVFMTQVFPSVIFPIREQLKTLTYAALTDSRA